MGKYSKTGKCIWCGRTEPIVTFSNKPHVLPDALGGEIVGYDICDDCNHYFGTCTRQNPISIDLEFKEIINAFRVFGSELSSDSYKKLNSIFFSYRHSKALINIKQSFKRISTEQHARLFKRGLFNVFLQKYHYVTGKGDSPEFDEIRKFVRYDIGDQVVGYARNHIILCEQDISHPDVPMSEKLIDNLEKYGVFTFHCIGHIFFLIVRPITFSVMKREFLEKEASKYIIRISGDEDICTLHDIMQLDFLMQRFHSQGTFRFK